MRVALSTVRGFREAIRILEREITGQLRSETGCCGVSLAQCHTLMELDANGPLSVSALAGRFALDQSTLSRTIDGMVRSGMVERVTDPNDRRAIQVQLSAQGQEKVAEIHGRCDEFYESLLASFPREKQQVVLEGILALAEGIRKLLASPCATSCRKPSPKKTVKKKEA